MIEFQNINLDNPKAQSAQDHCFKAHKEQEIHFHNAYTVNSISFNRMFNTLATAGSDGIIKTWNQDTKTKYYQSQPLPNQARFINESYRFNPREI
jgi:WD40 repeat protein